MPAIYFERLDKEKAKREKIFALVLFVAAAAVVYLSFTDYSSMPDPNASECKAGFEKTGCIEGYACKGELVDCKETNATFKYPFTRLLFDKPHCRSERIYREICVLK